MKKQVKLSSNNKKNLKKTIGDLTHAVAKLLKKGEVVNIQISPVNSQHQLYPDDSIPDWLKE